MKKPIKSLIIGLGMLLSLSACSLMPFDYKNGQTPNNNNQTNNTSSYTLSFDNKHMDCHVNKDYDNYFYVTDKSGQRISGSKEPTVNCNGDFVDYSIYRYDNVTWAINFISSAVQSATFTINMSISNSVSLSGTFNVSFYDDGPSNTSSVHVNAAFSEDTLLIPAYNHRYLHFNLMNDYGDFLPITSHDFEVNGDVQSSYNISGGDFTLVVWSSNYDVNDFTIRLYSDQGSAEYSNHFIFDDYRVIHNTPSTLIYGEGNPVSVSLRGTYHGLNKLINRVGVSSNGYVEGRDWYFDSVINASFDIYTYSYQGYDTIYLEVTDSMGDAYNTVFDVQLTETYYASVEAIYNFSDFSNLTTNYQYEFDMAIRGSGSGNRYQISNVSFINASSAFEIGWQYNGSNDLVKITMTTGSRTGSDRFGIRLYSPNFDQPYTYYINYKIS